MFELFHIFNRNLYEMKNAHVRGFSVVSRF